MKTVAQKLKPAKGFAHAFHITLTALLPVMVLVFVRAGRGNEFVPLALMLVLLSKWRMFAVRPRYWPANLRANAVDLCVGFASVLFMAQSESAAWQVSWTAFYLLWLLIIKPRSTTLMVSIQAGVGQTLGLVALFLAWGDIPSSMLVVSVWALCYLSARHFFTSFDEPYSSLYSHVWGYFAAALVWVLAHWLIFYGFLAQPALLLTVLGFGLSALYYLDETEKLTAFWRRQFIFVMIAVVVVVLALSDWTTSL
jgi:hypothetical protein